MQNPPGYRPNAISESTRWWNVAMAAALLAYGAFGLWNDDLYLPGKRRRGVHLHGMEAWLMYGAFVFASLNLLSVVLDHYDVRNNEARYAQFARWTRALGWIFFGVALMAHLIGSLGSWD